ncbi:Hypothetical protein I595_2878 [Croceitalea dokdonensis DOKDO 023]|uniref:Uncharacterized protein n=1 Tax=Croceitalea dokdonensis DOKDO 023 TaxID=1300341 RepID=A0A0N8H3L4_9FLAO|nr:hypothetical protein [Croceitalea dokdonensis]KPM30900.1 Hypothetical protein I595_2878 [Croceitalea dokdonensis DOKDO 023]
MPAHINGPSIPSREVVIRSFLKAWVDYGRNLFIGDSHMEAAGTTSLSQKRVLTIYLPFPGFLWAVKATVTITAIKKPTLFYSWLFVF